MNPNIARRRHAKAAEARLHGEVSSSNGRGGHSEVNVGEFERQASMIGGAVLAVCGLLRGSVSGLGLAVIGGAMVWRGYTGHCEMYHAMGHSSAEQQSDSHASEEPRRDGLRLTGHESHAAGDAL
jgi:uncharacterized membrane protein